MDRRTFLATISGGLLAAPLVAEAQPVGKVYRVAFLTLLPVPDLFEALRQGLHMLGWTEGENFVLEEQRATAEGKVSGDGNPLSRKRGGQYPCCVRHWRRSDPRRIRREPRQAGGPHDRADIPQHWSRRQASGDPKGRASARESRWSR